MEYIIGLARNPRLEALGAPLMAQAEAAFAAAGGKPRHFDWIQYAASPRRGRLMRKGANLP